MRDRVAKFIAAISGVITAILEGIRYAQDR